MCCILIIEIQNTLQKSDLVGLEDSIHSPSSCRIDEDRWNVPSKLKEDAVKDREKTKSA